MNKSDLITILEDFLRIVTEDPFTQDPDGDYVITYGGAKFYVRLQNEIKPIVQVFSVLAAELTPAQGLYQFLNSMNMNLEIVRVFHIFDQVLLEAEIRLERLDIESFAAACDSVADASDRFGPELIEVFGGNPRWELGKKATYKYGI